ncbi:MAG: adenylate/guanylate cyclase domain-containing protein [Candidatus Riflebacteria bacterium]|nr:adenylate/guanylate cyclase domain-containing protein [Candidatus Riflebacteria bacterium]
MSLPQNTRRLIESQKPSIQAAFLFWLIVVVIPLMLGKIILSIYVEHVFRTRQASATKALDEDIQIFEKHLEIEPFLTCKILEMEKELKLPSLIENDFAHGRIDYECENNFNDDELLNNVREKFLTKTGGQPLFVFVLNSSEKKVARWMDPSRKNWTRFPGKSATMILMKALLAQSVENSYLTPHKLFPNILDTLFGTGFETPLKNRRLRHDFSWKLGGKRLFVYCNFFPTRHANQTSVNGYLVAFTESSISAKKHFEWARNFSNTASVKRLFCWAKANYSMKNLISGDNLLRVFRPFPMKALRIGSHADKSIISHNIKNGRLLERPAKSLFLITQTSLNRERISLDKRVSVVNLFLLLANFLSLLFLKKLCMDGKLSLKIHSKLFLVILTAMIMPLLGFFVVATRYFDFFQDLLISNHQKTIIQDLQLLELSLRDNEMKSRTKLDKFKEKLNLSIASSEKEISRILNSELGKMHDGYTFIRNDGLTIDNLPTFKDMFPQIRQKIEFYSDIFKSQSTRIFTYLKLLKGNDLEKYRSSTKGKTILAMGELFNDIDMDSFCQQVGEVFQAEKSNFGNFRLITYNLLPNNQRKTEHWAFVAFLHNVRRITSDFLQGQTENWKFFLRRENGILTNTVIFPVEREDSDKFELMPAWPKKMSSNADLINAANRISSGKSNESWITYSKDGIPTIYAVRRMYNMPFIAVSKAVLGNETGSKSLLDVIGLVLLLYSFLLISIIAHSLTEVFINPLKALFRATSLVNMGEYPRIEYESELELAKVSQKFNLMTVGLQERQKLERFVSSDATRTIVSESLDLREHIGEKIEAAILFAHIRDFDNLCEQLSAEDIINCLNHYFAAMEPIIQNNNGVIDKYIQDAIMVVFSRQDCEFRLCQSDACWTGYKMVSAQESLNEKLLNNKLPPITIGVGIAFGDVIKGKIGALAGRKDFTVIGDVVNFSARLEALSHKHEQASILVSETLSKACSAEFNFTNCGEILIKGKKEKQTIFELTGARSAAN